MSAGTEFDPPSPAVWHGTSGLDHMRVDGRAEHPSHEAVVNWLERRYAGSYRLLDCGVMSGVTYETLRAAGSRADYVGVDVSRAVIEDCASRFPQGSWVQMTVFDLSYGAGSFDVVHCRHLLENLPYYETAVREMFRVARDAVVLCLGQVPADPERLYRRETANGYIWFNRYSPAPLEALLRSLSARVESVDVSGDHRMNRIYYCDKRA